MLSDLFTRLFNTHPGAYNEETEDPGFTAFMETLHARRATEDWFMPGPEGDLYRQRCRDEEMMRMESRNYGFRVNPASVCSVSLEQHEKNVDFLVLRLTQRTERNRRWRTDATEAIEKVFISTQIQLFRSKTEAGNFSWIMRYFLSGLRISWGFLLTRSSTFSSRFCSGWRFCMGSFSFGNFVCFRGGSFFLNF